MILALIRLRYALLLLLSSLAVVAPALPVAAATEHKESVPIDLAKAAVSRFGPVDVTFYADPPEGFPDFNIPAEAEMLGSYVRDRQAIVILRVDSAAGLRRQEIVRQFEQMGYSIHTRTPPDPERSRGFITPSRPPDDRMVLLCHDERGMLLVTIGVLPDAEAISLSTSLDAPTGQFSCSGLLRPMPNREGIHALLPVLHVPEEATSSYAGSGHVLAGRTVEAESRLSINLEPEQLEEHFAEQMLDQGWERDIVSSSGMSAVSTWISDSEFGRLFGTLQLINTGGDQFELKLTLQLLLDP